LNELINNGSLSESPKKISKAQTYRLLNCIKVLDYLKDYEIQPCNERICRALKQYGKNKENIRLLWEQVLSYVNNKKEAINSILVKNIWIQMNSNKKNVYENMNNNYDNVQSSYPNNYNQEQRNSYPTPDKTIFIKELNINSGNKCNNNYSNSFLPSPEFKPMMIENSYNAYQNNSNNIINNRNEDNNSIDSSESDSSEFKCTYPALYKPAWTISMEQLRNCNNNTTEQQQYPSPVSTTFPNNYNMNYNY